MADETQQQGTPEENPDTQPDAGGDMNELVARIAEQIGAQFGPRFEAIEKQVRHTRSYADRVSGDNAALRRQMPGAAVGQPGMPPGADDYGYGQGLNLGDGGSDFGASPTDQERLTALEEQAAIRNMAEAYDESLRIVSERDPRVAQIPGFKEVFWGLLGRSIHDEDVTIEQAAQTAYDKAIRSFEGYKELVSRQAVIPNPGSGATPPPEPAPSPQKVPVGSWAEFAQLPVE